MKKLFAIPLLSALFFGACSDNEKSASAPETKGIVFELAAVEKLSDGNISRAPLYSQEAVQSVEVVNVYVFQKSGADYLYLKTIAISDWTKGSAFMRYEVPAGEMLPEGDYKFLAVGTDAADVNPYTITTPTSSTNFNDFSAWITAANNQELELFAGSKAAMVEGTGVRVPIEMTRQVAGVLGYFKNVPVESNGQTVRYLKLTASNADKMVNLTTGIGSDPLNTTYDIIHVDLSTQGQNAEGAYTGNDLTAQGVVKLENTQLNGAFLLPVNGITLTLGLYAADNTPLKTWTVAETGTTVFDILPNHFYSLGTKAQADNTDGGGTTPDTPIDLMKDQVISITITADWTLIHNLELQ